MFFFRLSLFTLFSILFALTGIAKASDTNTWDDCLLVPFAKYESDQIITVVGLIAATQSKIHWAFFDQTGTRQASGTIANVNANGFASFAWNSTTPGQVPANLNRLGYLLFCQDQTPFDDSIAGEPNTLSGNAFFVNLTAKDVAMVPTVPIDEADLGNPLPTQWTNDPIVNITNAGAVAGDTVDVKYLADFDTSNADGSKVYIYASQSLARNQNAQIFNANGDQRNVTFLAESRLSEVDVDALQAVTGGTAGFGDGYLSWAVPPGVASSFVFAFITETTNFGAVQTILGNDSPP